jgi:hypothetical protein
MIKSTHLSQELEAQARATLLLNGAQDYTRTPFEIEAMPVTAENIEIIGDLVDGTFEADRAIPAVYVERVHAISGPPARRRRMFFQAGDFLTRYKGKVRIYTEAAFTREFSFVRESDGQTNISSDIDAVFTYAHVYKSSTFSVLAGEVTHKNMVALHKVFGVLDDEGSGVDYVELRPEWLKSPNPKAEHGVRAPLGHFIVLNPGFMRVYNPRAFHETFRVSAPVVTLPPVEVMAALVLGKIDEGAAEAI